MTAAVSPESNRINTNMGPRYEWTERRIMLCFVRFPVINPFSDDILLADIL